MRAINLKTNHLTEPVCIDAGTLFLSWQCADGVRQTAYEIELTANGETVWHSGKVQSAVMHADAPGWLYEVGKGATTVWETWTGIDENGKPHESLNHYSYGAICGWLFGGVCGIHYADGTLTIAPTPDKSLGSAKAAYDSPAGRIVSGWRYDGDAVTYEFEIPANLTADVTLPDGRKLTLAPGKHTV